MAETAALMTTIQHPFVFRLLQTRRVEQLTPRMRRIVLAGPALAGFTSLGADDGARTYFPADPHDTSWAPTVSGNSLVFPDGVTPPPGREYTPRRYDPDAGELSLDILTHDVGPASTWAANAQPGHWLGVSGPRRSRPLSPDLDWLLLAGDETGLPAIGRRLEELPAGVRALVVVEVQDASEEQPLPTQADIELRWLHRDGVSDPSGLVADAVRALTLPDGVGFAWAAGEASSMRALRRHLLNERGLSPDVTRVTGYWKRGIANHDHHAPLE
jgi:NADPH-dependent ferric siderophore reductase